MSRMTRRQLLQTSLTGLGVLASGQTQGAGLPPAFSFHYDHLLGTSLDGWVHADAADARAAERLVLAEIERGRRVFSPFDPDSELSRLNRAAGPMPASPDLIAVLRAYEAWNQRTGGACSARLGELVRLWGEAERTGVLPSEASLSEAARRIAGPGFSIDGQAVTRLTDLPLNLNSVAKGYIIDRAVRAVMANLPAVSGLLINLGGDIGGWGEFLIGVQDPNRPADNERPLTAVRLSGAVATSGGYQRFYTVGGTRYSHLLDPRTGRPADALAAATVLAPTSALANALATALCVLPPDDGLRLIDAIPGTACLLITPDGRQVRSRTFAAQEVPVRADEPAKPESKPKGDPWMSDHQVTISLELPRPTGGRRIRRPYVAIWIEGADGKPVRSVTVWGSQRRWLPTMSGWWKVARDDDKLIRAVTRATRAPGKYTVVWDGKDDSGKALPQGVYTVKVEVHREHGKHVFQTGKLTCAGEPARLTLEKNAETGDTLVEYGKRK